MASKGRAERKPDCGPAQDQRGSGSGVDQQLRTPLETRGSTDGLDVVDEPDAHSIAFHAVAEVVVLLLVSNPMQRTVGASFAAVKKSWTPSPEFRIYNLDCCT
jgi:hypothetical protein